MTVKNQKIPRDRESVIQKRILDWLTLLERTGKLTFIRNNSFAGTIQRGNGSLGYIKNKKVGSADIIACINGNFVAFEIKSASGYQSPEQKKYQGILEKCGGWYYLVRSFDEFVRILQEDFGL